MAGRRRLRDVLLRHRDGRGGKDGTGCGGGGWRTEWDVGVRSLQECADIYPYRYDMRTASLPEGSIVSGVSTPLPVSLSFPLSFLFNLQNIN